jgi:multidrug efflux system membrane fusion protein
MSSGYSPLLVAALAAASLAGCDKEPVAPVAVRPVLVQKAAPGGARPTVYAGEIRARYESDLGFRIAGKIVARLVDVGAAVKAGQALARLDPADAAQTLKEAEANLSLADAEAKRYRELLAKHFVSQSALDAKETALKAAVAQAALARNQAAYTTLAADHDGVVTAVVAEVGQVVAAGQAVFRVARPGEKEALINVPEGRLAEFRAAKSLTVTPWADPALTLPGRLRELAPAADAATRTYAARISVAANPALELGMTVRVELPPADGDGTVLVPSAAVVDQGQGPAVWIVTDGHAQRRPVHVRQHREDGELLDAGVKPGELVVVVGAHKLVAGEPVRPQLAENGTGARQ